MTDSETFQISGCGTLDSIFELGRQPAARSITLKTISRNQQAFFRRDQTLLARRKLACTAVAVCQVPSTLYLGLLRIASWAAGLEGRPDRSWMDSCQAH